MAMVDFGFLNSYLWISDSNWEKFLNNSVCFQTHAKVLWYMQRVHNVRNKQITWTRTQFEFIYIEFFINIEKKNLKWSKLTKKRVHLEWYTYTKIFYTVDTKPNVIITCVAQCEHDRIWYWRVAYSDYFPFLRRKTLLRLRAQRTTMAADSSDYCWTWILLQCR